MCEKGIAPETVTAAKYEGEGAAKKATQKGDNDAAHCAYPMVARYKGTGSIDDATNFACQAEQ